MVGFYPGPNKNLKLNTWQQAHSDPPIVKGKFRTVEWDALKADLNDDALAGGFSPYPINMIDLAQDVLLHINGDNCPRYGKIQEEVKAS